MEWKIHQDREEDDSLNSYSITLDGEYGGWRTDSGYDGYGLPKELAIWICEILNQSKKECPFTFEFGCWKKEGEDGMD